MPFVERLTADRERLVPDDVEWVVEWQLSTCFPWLPLASDGAISAGPAPSGKFWPVTVRVAQTEYRLSLPTRDLIQVVRWCHSVTRFHELLHPPRRMARSLHGLRNALRLGVTRGNPLDRMGYRRGAEDNGAAPDTR